MNTRNRSALMISALCTLLVPAVASAQSANTFPEFIALGASPEGVAVDKVGNVFVSVQTATGSDQIWKFSPAGEKSFLVDFGAPGYACGLAVDPVGNVYMARPLVPGRGVYKVGPDGSAVRLPGSEQILFADGLAFDQQGTLYITEVFSGNPPPGPFDQGGIWRIKKGAAAELWLRHDLLTGVAPTLFPFPLGANGIAFYLGSLYVVSTDKMLVVRIPVLPDGSPGEPEVWKQLQDVPESFLYQSPFPPMIDGLSMDVHGNVYVASPSRNAIIRINAADQSQETIAVFPALPPPRNAPQAMLDAPLSLAFGTGTGERQNLFITDSGMLGAFLPGTWPGPGVVKIEIGIPGLPLP
jgi:sugar lactone lactonase YvrE